MKRLRFLLLAGFVVAATRATTATASGATATEDTVLRWHFGGFSAFAGATNYIHLVQALSLSNSTSLQKDVTAKLGSKTAELFQSGTTSKDQAAALAPLWNDLLQNESIGEWTRHGSESSEFLGFVKLPAAQIAVWDSNLRRALAGWGHAPKNDANGGWTASLGNGASLRFARQGEWLMLRYGAKDGSSNPDWLQQVKAGFPPELFSDPLEFLTTDINWPKLAAWLPHALGPVKPARARLTLRMKSDTVRAEMQLHYPSPIPWQSGEWSVPEIIRWPLSSLTVLHNIGAFLNESAFFQALGFNPLASDLFVWAQTDARTQTFFLSKVADAQTSFQNLAVNAHTLVNPLLQSWNWGQLGVDPPTITANDFTDIDSMAKRLAERTDPVAVLLRKGMAPSFMLPLVQYHTKKTNPDSFRNLLIGELNKILNGPSLAPAPEFQNLKLRPETIAAQAKNPTGLSLARLNRLLLEDAFPTELSRERRLRQTGVLPLVSPTLSATNDATGQYLYGTFFIPSSRNQAIPPQLERLAKGGPDLVYYDWEVTQTRLEQWRELRTTLPLFAVEKAAFPFQTDESQARLGFEQKWLGDLARLLGESVTEMRRVSPTDFAFKRKSYSGLTAIELVYLAHWLTDPAFPFSSHIPSGGVDDLPAIPALPALPAPPVAK